MGLGRVPKTCKSCQFQTPKHSALSILISDCCLLKFGCLFYMIYLRPLRSAILTPIGAGSASPATSLWQLWALTLLGLGAALPGVLVILTLLQFHICPWTAFTERFFRANRFLYLVFHYYFVFSAVRQIKLALPSVISAHANVSYGIVSTSQSYTMSMWRVCYIIVVAPNGTAQHHSAPLCVLGRQGNEDALETHP